MHVDLRTQKMTLHVREEIETRVAADLVRGGMRLTRASATSDHMGRSITTITAVRDDEGIKHMPEEGTISLDEIDDPEAHMATVIAVDIPAYSTIGHVTAVDDEGDVYSVIGDHRPLFHIYEALMAGEEPRIALFESFGF